MARRAGTADLPLHSGRVPAWLGQRMAKLGAVIAEAIVHHYGRDELLRRLAHPFWFQSFGAVMGMDWHSSGITTSVVGALKRGLTPLAKIVSWATAGVDPAVMGSGPIPASRKALEKAGWKVRDLDLVEANEAFAAQAIAVNKDMGWDPPIVNVNGGAIAIGHPIGASGARVLTTLLFEMQKRGAKKGLATLCIGGGMGVALTVER